MLPKTLLALAWVLVAYTSHAQHSCAFCQYLPENKNAKPLLKQIKEQVDAIAVQQQDHLMPVKKALEATAGRLDSLLVCVDSAYLLQSRYRPGMDHLQQAENYTLFLQFSKEHGNGRTMGLTFYQRKGIELDKLFFSIDTFGVDETFDPKTELDYRPLLGKYYNVKNHFYKIELKQDKVLRSVSLLIDGHERYYFRKLSDSTIENNAYAFWSVVNLHLVQVDRDKIILCFPDSKNAFGEIFRRYDELESMDN